MERGFYQAFQVIARQLERCSDREQVYWAALEGMLNYLPAEAGCVLEADSGELQIVASRGYPELELKVGAGNQMALLERLLQVSEPCALPDRHAEPGGWDVSSADFRSWLGEVVRVDGQTNAFFVFESKAIGGLTDIHAYLLGIVCAQVELALKNIGLRAEMERRLRRERKLSELIHTITGELDLPLILHHVVRMTAEILQADCGALGLLTPDHTSIEYAYLYNLPDVLQERVTPAGSGMAGGILESGNAVWIERYAEHPQAAPEWKEVGVQVCIGAPVTDGEEQLGVLLLFSKEHARQFGDSDLMLLQMVGRQAGLAIQNARLFDKERQRADEYEALRNTLADLTAVLDLPQLLKSILERAVTLLMASGGELGLCEPETNTIRVVASYKMGKDYSGASLAMGEGAIGRAVATGAPVVVDDYPSWEGRSSHYSDSPCHAVMAAPLVLRDRMLGAISVMDTHPDRQFSLEDMNLLALFAQQAAVAVENAQHYDHAQYLATVDGLTGLFNRRYFFEMARRELERSLRYGHPLSAVMLDIDWFKGVNDTYGHPVGDQVLQAVAGICKEKLREVDLLARYGGEEFVILLPNTALHGARQVAERLHRSIGEMAVSANGHLIRVTVSLGVAELGASCPTLEALLECADQALMKAKQAGRNRVSVHWPV